jgi:probable rRNA maturation factor
MLELRFSNQSGKDVEEKIFLDVLEKVNKYLPKLDVELKDQRIITLTLVDDNTIRSLNKEYRGIDKPTDVLSFSYLGDEPFPGEEDIVGEVFISLESAKDELDFLFVHGVLHILGYTHETDEGLKDLIELQKEILDQ